LAGRTSGDGEVYVAKGKGGEVGKLNLKDGNVNSIWSHDDGCSGEGEILIVGKGAPVSWVKVKKGEAMPPDAFKAGSNKSDGDMYACRNTSGAVGKLNLSDGKVNNFWYHGDYFSKKEGEVLCVGPVPPAGGGGGGGYAPKAKPKPKAKPSPAPAPAPAPKPADTSHFNGDADCDGVSASDRVKWLVNEKGMKEADAKAAVMEEFPDVFSDTWMPGAMCDGVSAQDRAQWLVDNQGMDMNAARAQIKSEFPKVFGDWWNPDASCGGSPAKDRAQWLVDNKGLTMDAAKQQIRREFPAAFGGGSDGPVINCAFPHTMSIEQTGEGPKL
jgi:hypothetical protein